jgi:phage head maturation protease
MPLNLTLTQQLAEDIRARIKSLDFTTVEKLAKAKDANGTFDVIISTEDVDRGGDIIRQNGWEFANYKNNPVVLWGHDYYSLPIGVCTETYLTEQNGVPALGAKGFFYPADINPFAQQVRKMYELGIKTGHHVGCTTSVGFIPREFEPDNRSIITRAELLEFSFVPVPANQSVGPAEGRALTVAEAKEIGLDIEALAVKGLELTEEEPETPESAEDESNDTPETEEKTFEETRPLKKQLLQSIADEQARHTAEIDKAVDSFSDATAGEGEGSDEEKAATLAESVREAMKDVRDAVRDEHNMHRAKSISCFRSFTASQENVFDKKAHLNSLRDAHDAYEAKNTKALEDFEARGLKATRETLDEQLDVLAGVFESNQRAHKKSITRLAKAMCKDAFGEEEAADEQVLDSLKTFLTPYVPEPMQRAVFMKVGARISAVTKEKLGEAHEHLNAASAIVKALHGGLGDDDGEESRSDGDEKSAPAPAPKKQRSRPSEAHKDELNDFLFAKELVRDITTAAQRGLETLNKRGKQ